MEIREHHPFTQLAGLFNVMGARDEEGLIKILGQKTEELPLLVACLAIAAEFGDLCEGADAFVAAPHFNMWTIDNTVVRVEYHDCSVQRFRFSQKAREVMSGLRNADRLIAAIEGLVLQHEGGNNFRAVQTGVLSEEIEVALNGCVRGDVESGNKDRIHAIGISANHFVAAVLTGVMPASALSEGRYGEDPVQGTMLRIPAAVQVDAYGDSLLPIHAARRLIHEGAEFCGICTFDRSGRVIE